MEALRSIVGTARRRPAKLAYFVISLGLSFGFIAAVVTLAHASWFRLPAGVQDRDYVTAMRASVGESIKAMSLRDFDEISGRVPEISWFHVTPAYWLLPKSPPSSGAHLFMAHLASPEFFEHLGARPEFGSLSPTQGAPAAVITEEVWRRAYGRQDIIGEYLTIEDGTSIPIIGVAPPGFEGPLQDPVNVWMMNLPLELSMPPIATGVNAEGKRRIAYLWSYVTVFGVIPEGRHGDAEFAAARDRLAEHRFDSETIVVETESAPSAEGDSRSSRQMFAFGFRDADRVVFSRGLETSPDKRAEVVQRTLWLAGVVAMLLLMAFVAVVEFLLAEHVSREDEQNVRIAVGAAPMDLFGRALAENLVLAVAMGFVGWLAAGYALDVLLRVEPFSGYLGEVTGASWFAGIGIAGLMLVLAFVICLGYVSWFVSRSAAALVRSGQWLRRTIRQLLLLVCVASFVVVLSLAGRYLGDARLSLGLANPDVPVVSLRDPNRQPGLVTPVQLAEAIDAIEAIPGVHAAAAATPCACRIEGATALLLAQDRWHPETGGHDVLRERRDSRLFPHHWRRALGWSHVRGEPYRDRHIALCGGGARRH